MATQLNEALEQTFQEFQEFEKQEEYGSSFERLAEIYNVLENQELPKKVKFTWMEKVNSALASFGCFEDVEARVKSNVDRVNRIFSVGESFDEDEILLILTLMIEVDLGLALFGHLKCYPISLDYESLNSKLNEIESSNVNKNDFLLAVQMIKKNSLLPIVSRCI